MIPLYPKKIKQLLSLLDVHTFEVVQKSFTSIIVKIVGLFFGVLISILLGRILGADGLGIISLANRIGSLVLILCLFGMREVIVKEVAIAHNNNDRFRIGQIMRVAYIINGLVTVTISTILIVSTPYLATHFFNDERLIFPLILVSIVIIPQVFSRVFSAGINGYRKIWQSNLVDETLSFVIIGLVLFALILFNVEITVNTAAIVYAVGRSTVTITTGLYWNRLFKSQTKSYFDLSLTKQLLKTSLPLLLFSVSMVVATNTDVIMIGWLSSSKEVGLYSVSSRLSIMTLFFLNVTNSALAPKIASMFAEGKRNELAKMLQKVTRGLALIGILTLVLYIFLGKFILNIWGDDFVEAYPILIILSIGQFVNIATGAAGMTLIMSGEEKLQSIITFSSASLNILLNYFLIMYYGALGAACATAFSVSIENIAKILFVKKKIKISMI